ncbi:sensor histidine kinase [Rhizobium sp. ICMP 5592]|nr:sensor histidine kinase [Rhizobium sp. ICMP 5592]
MENLESPVRELRRLYREAEAKAARLRLIVEARNILDTMDFEIAARQVLALVCSFCGASAARIEFPDDQTTEAIRYERGASQPSLRIVFAVNLKGNDPRISLSLAQEIEALTTDDDQQTLKIVADQLLAALNDKRRQQEREAFTEALRSREAMLAHLVGEMISAQEKERARVAYDLHDGVAQSLVSLLFHLQAATVGQDMDAQTAQNLTDCIDLARRCVGDIRHAIADLRPAELDDLGLAAAIRAKLDSMRIDHVSFSDQLGETRLPRAVEIVLYRVAQEALANAEKHAACTHVQIELAENADGVVMLTVSDDGRGFAAGDHRPERGHGVGLPAMRERLALVGGTLSIESAPGAGTRLLAEVPTDLNRESSS